MEFFPPHRWVGGPRTLNEKGGPQPHLGVRGRLDGPVEAGFPCRYDIMAIPGLGGRVHSRNVGDSAHCLRVRWLPHTTSRLGLSMDHRAAHEPGVRKRTMNGTFPDKPERNPEPMRSRGRGPERSQTGSGSSAAGVM